jgi:hypothetical protein
VDDSAADTFSDGDSGSLSDNGGTDNGSDTATIDTNGNDSLSIHESGSSTDSGGRQVFFTLDDSASDSYTDDGSGNDTETNGQEHAAPGPFEDDVQGNADVHLHENGTRLLDNGSTVTFTLSDGIHENINDDDDATNASGGATTTLSLDGGDSFSVHENGATPTASSSITFNVDASSNGTFTDNDDEVYASGDPFNRDDPSSGQATLSLTDGGVNQSSSTETSNDGTDTKSTYSKDTFTIHGADDAANGVATLTATSDDHALQSFSDHLVGGDNTYPTIQDTSSYDSFSVHDLTTAAGSASPGGGNGGGAATVSSDSMTRDDDGTNTYTVHSVSPSANGGTHTVDGTKTTTYHKHTAPFTRPDGTTGTEVTNHETIHEVGTLCDTGRGGATLIDTFDGEPTTVMQDGQQVSLTGGWSSSEWSSQGGSLSTSGNYQDPPPVPDLPPVPQTGGWFDALGLDKMADVVVGGLDKATGGLSTQGLSSQAFGTVLDGYDQFYAGTASALTAGLTDRLREKMYGETATRNHQGTMYNVGQVAGTGLGLATSFANPCNMAGGWRWVTGRSTRCSWRGTRSTPMRTGRKGTIYRRRSTRWGLWATRPLS